jgi:hypothetical protein
MGKIWGKRMQRARDGIRTRKEKIRLVVSLGDRNGKRSVSDQLIFLGIGGGDFYIMSLRSPRMSSLQRF